MTSVRNTGSIFGTSYYIRIATKLLNMNKSREICKILSKLGINDQELRAQASITDYSQVIERKFLYLDRTSLQIATGYWSAGVYQEDDGFVLKAIQINYNSAISRVSQNQCQPQSVMIRSFYPLRCKLKLILYIKYIRLQPFPC